MNKKEKKGLWDTFRSIISLLLTAGVSGLMGFGLIILNLINLHEITAPQVMSVIGWGTMISGLIGFYIGLAIFNLEFGK